MYRNWSRTTSLTALIRVFAFLLTLASIFYHCKAHAQCAAMFCEMDCRQQAQVTFPGGSYQDPAVFNSCLSKEQACRASMPAAKFSCESSVDYQLTLAGAREAARTGAVTTFGQCRDINFWATQFVEKKGGKVAGTISDVCGCFLCETAMQPQPTSPPLSSPQDVCKALQARYIQSANSGIPESILSDMRQEMWNSSCPVPR